MQVESLEIKVSFNFLILKSSSPVLVPVVGIENMEKGKLKMNSQALKTAYNALLINRREGYRQSICNSNFVNSDGSNNSKQIAIAAKCEAQELISTLEYNTIDSLVSQMDEYMKKSEWDELSAFLLIHFYIICDRPPTLFAIRTAHSEVFQEYCKYLYQYLYENRQA